jgi:hypothetical protein
MNNALFILALLVGCFTELPVDTASHTEEATSSFVDDYAFRICAQSEGCEYFCSVDAFQLCLDEATPEVADRLDSCTLDEELGAICLATLADQGCNVAEVEACDLMLTDCQ